MTSETSCSTCGHRRDAHITPHASTVVGPQDWVACMVLVRMGSGRGGGDCCPCTAFRAAA